MKKIFVLSLLSLTFTCKQDSSDMHDYTNSLIHSTSPYLIQHAHNPVNWQEWSEKTLFEAKKKDKPILVSIGYSSCHWCHVMEKESFEDTAIARTMNEHFINIKVDREERPDIDQVYMDAVHAMGLQGGWPLNVFLTPDQKPFYGGTYFPKERWRDLLTSIVDAYEENREKVDQSAEAFTKSLQLKESEKYKLKGTDYRFSKEEINFTYQNLAKKFDTINGGVKKAPKFPMPPIWQYLATYYHCTKDNEALKHLELTLEKIADGGIYDHVGGGFARYSTDGEWHVPHFEKMLYDNGQLLSLYANGYKLTKNPKFKQRILETLEWLKREMLDVNGGFYSALDADSENEEGKFYVWTYDEVKKITGSGFEKIADYYDVRPKGNWDEKNVLRIVKSKEQISEKFGMTMDQVNESISLFKTSALKKRGKKVRPSLDHKIIAGWNGLTLSGLSEAYQALSESFIAELAHKNAQFIKNKLIKNGILHRFPNKKMEGFMEDYAIVIQAFIKYYETTRKSEYLQLAKQLTLRTEEFFYDKTENLYFFTSNRSQNLIARKKELFDNVIAASNSIMAWNLVHLGTHFYDDAMVEKGKSMLAQVKELIKQEPEYMSNWGELAMELSVPFSEVIIVGPEVDIFMKEINAQFIPNKIITGTKEMIEKAPFEYKSMIDGQTTIYVCYNKTCKLPVTSVEEALELIND